MKNKKLLFKALISSSLVGCSIPLVILGSCSSNVENNTEGNNPLTSKQDDNAAYCTVTFDDLDGKVTITGAKKVAIKVGRPLGSIKFPIASKKNGRFRFWCTDLEHPIETEVTLSEPVDQNKILYPFFENQIQIKDCVGITVIEKTKIWLDIPAGNAAPNLEYSDEYGKEESWKPVAQSEETSRIFEPGENIFLAGLNADGFNTESQKATIKFSDTGAVNLVGNVMGLLDYAAADDDDKNIDKIPDAYCFANLFAGNKAIKYVSDTFLPATTLKGHCYESMFEGCTSLKLPATLPAETLEDSCYSSMFKNCTSLELVNIKYSNAFASTTFFTDWLSGVTTTGQLIYGGTYTVTGFLPSTWSVVPPETKNSIHVVCTDEEVVEGYKLAASHNYHFRAQHNDEGHTECKNIIWKSTNSNVATVNPDTGVVTGIRANKVGEQCKIIAYSRFDQDIFGEMEITVRDLELEDFMSFKNIDNEIHTKPEDRNNVNFYFDFIGAGTAPTFEYSTDGKVWQKLWIAQPVQIKPGDTVYIKGDNPKDGLNGGKESSSSQTRFFFEPDTNKQCGMVEVGGSIMGLIDDGRGEITQIPSKYCFNSLFENVSYIKKVSSDFLSQAKTLTTGCFLRMFSFDHVLHPERNSALETIPSLSVTNLTGANSCYSHMYDGCNSLVNVPTNYLPAGTISQYCYNGMFFDCTSLKNTPALPATTAAAGCYYGMFQNCAALNVGSIGKITFKKPATYSCYQMYASTGDSRFSVYSGGGRSLVFNFSDVSADNCVWAMINTTSTTVSKNTDYYA